MMISRFEHLRRAFHEDKGDFWEAWLAQDARALGNEIPELCPEPFMLQYRELTLQGKYLQRLIENFSNEQVKVVCFEDFIHDPTKIYEQILNFMNLSPFPNIQWTHANPRKQVKSGFPVKSVIYCININSE